MTCHRAMRMMIIHDITLLRTSNFSLKNNRFHDVVTACHGGTTTLPGT